MRSFRKLARPADNEFLCVTVEIFPVKRKGIEAVEKLLDRLKLKLYDGAERLITHVVLRLFAGGVFHFHC